MFEIQWNSPFGARPISAALIRREDGVRRAQARLRAEKPDVDEDAGADGPDKWVLLRALTEARAHFRLSDRTLSVLEALLSCHAQKRIDPSRPQIVFPSNRELSLRTRGMADATLRRHLASLIEAGLLLRRDSPNGKRYRRRDLEEGDEAFGFDLSPFALCATEIFARAEQARAEARKLRRLRTEIALCRRDIRKILDAALIEERAGDWGALEQAWQELSRPLSRSATASELEQMSAHAIELRTKSETLYLSVLSEQEMSGNDAHGERHYQDSNPDTLTEIAQEEKNEEKSEVEQPMRHDADAAPVGQGGEALRRLAEREAPDVGTVMTICPTLADYSRTPIRSRRDFEVTADLVRGFLGISSDAYRAAQAAMGPYEAAITIAALLERADRVRSPGGYLRALTAKAGTKRFRVGPMLEALRNQSLRS
ncbi:plasmid replication protein RepC [Aureimonas sp. AU40]|uniref:plasmid replication protein RepC n=1 Tax=Aureimonas sp. AU40 TaxID=1637747 RepID=UPI0007815D7A|nr:plasmid replication protein RepC [Aureimonas sp. AU40]